MATVTIGKNGDRFVLTSVRIPENLFIQSGNLNISRSQVLTEALTEKISTSTNETG